MKKINVAGMSSLIGGICMFGFHELGGFMGKSGNLNSYNKAKAVDEHATMYSMLHEDNFDWIESLPWGFLREGADYVVNMPFWLLLVIVGGFLLLLGGIFIKR
jgi:hypothetical protein